MALDLVLAEALDRGVGDEATSRCSADVSTSLDAMASGGIYDHIGGGFARYSVDERWLVPHFEKMLYDQALLVRVYAHAAGSGDTDRWRQVVHETVGYVLRDLRQPGGGFSSAEDADSPGPDGHNHEGLFYTWTPDEVRRRRRRRRRRPCCEFYDITDAGNFEQRSIPNRIGTLARRLAAAAGRSRRPVRRCSMPAGARPGPASTTRC